MVSYEKLKPSFTCDDITYNTLNVFHTEGNVSYLPKMSALAITLNWI